MARRTDIRDVARAAGVSVTTVSHALNEKGRMTAATRERVRTVASMLGYQASTAARYLAGAKAGLLAMQFSDMGRGWPELADLEYFTRIVSAATSRALAYGYSLVVVPGGGAHAWGGRLPIDGAIVIDPVIGDAVLTDSESLGIPVVMAGRRPEAGGEGYWVDNDYSLATDAVLDHLEAMGAHLPALVTSPPVRSFAAQSISTYEEWMARRNLEPMVCLVRDDLTEGGGYSAFSRLFKRRTRPDAIHATVDRLALGVLLAAEAAGTRVPEHLLVSSLSDSSVVRLARPPLTAVDTKPDFIGRLAVDMLVALVDKRPIPQPHIVVPVHLIARESTRRVG